MHEFRTFFADFEQAWIYLEHDCNWILVFLIL